MIDDESLMEALSVLCREYDSAVSRHPFFENNYKSAVCLIIEELGELAKEINDGKDPDYTIGKPGWRERAITEAAHVAVTAIRTIQLLKRGIQ